MALRAERQTLQKVIISILGIMMLVCAINFSKTSYAQEQEDPYFEDLVLAVFADNEPLSAGMFAVQQNGRYYLPVGTLSEILGFYVDIDRERRFAKGNTMSSVDTFEIDGISNTISFRGEVAQLPKEAFLDASVADDDIYLVLEAFNQIWPLNLSVNLSALVLRVDPDDKLPFQQALARKEQQQRIRDRQEKFANELADNESLPFVAKPYQAFSKPVLDLQAEAGFDARLNDPEYRFSLNGVNDLGYASADYSLNLSQTGGVFNKPDNFRLRFRRQNIHEGALPFGLEDTQWGDINLKNRNLISTGLQGRGLIFSTRENRFANEFDRLTIDGVATPGFEVELYINDELIDFGVVDPRGEYRFEDVAIGFGNNRLRVVLYGPQGQIEERVENYFFQSNMVKAGENEFSGGIVDSENDLIPIDERNIASRPKGLAANIYGARGISERLTVFGTLNTLKDRDLNNEERRSYASVGAIGGLGNTLAQAEIYKQLDGGQAVDVRTLSDFKGFKINTQTALYSDFESPSANDNQNAKEFEFDFDVKKIFSTVIGSLGLEAGVDYLRRKSGANSTVYTTRQSLGVRGTRLTHQTRTNLSDNSHVATSGRLSSTTRKRDWRFRNSFNYRVFPELEATSIQGEVRYGKRDDFSTAFRAERNFNSKETILGVQLTKDFDKFLGSIEADWSSQFGTSFLVRASTALAPYGPNGEYIMEADPLRNLGPISAFVYQDNDYDGLYSEGDEPVPDVKMTVGRRISKEETNEDGFLREINPSAGGKTAVRVATNTIDDPYMVPSDKTPGYRVYPRPGIVHTVQLPLIETGAIDGTLSWEADGRPIGGLSLQLMNAQGDIVKESKTGSDGYFTFERIPPNSYTIRANPESGLNIPFKYVELTPDNLFQFGVDIQAVDLNRPVVSDLGVGVGNDGMLNAKNIISIAKGYKGKKGTKKNLQPVTSETIKKGVQQASVKAKSATGGPAVVQSVRIGQHPGKVRIVMDLSAQTPYELSHDPKSNSIFVELPYATWSARQSWKGVNSKILNNYKVEKTGSGSRLMLGVEDGVDIGASGLLKANGDKKDRLYIDIEKK